ncbi:MAG: hypothetical protein V4665_03140 [Patescibacteria group bacterium]
MDPQEITTANTLEINETPSSTLKAFEQSDISIEDFFRFADTENKTFKNETVVKMENANNSINLDQETFDKIKQESNIDSELAALDEEAEKIIEDLKKEVGIAGSDTEITEGKNIFQNPEDDPHIARMDKEINQRVKDYLGENADYKDAYPARVHKTKEAWNAFLRENPDKAEAYLAFGDSAYKNAELAPGWYRGLQQAERDKKNKESYDTVIESFNLNNGSRVMLDGVEYNVTLGNAGAIELVSTERKSDGVVTGYLTRTFVGEGVSPTQDTYAALSDMLSKEKQVEKIPESETFPVLKNDSPEIKKEPMESTVKDGENLSVSGTETEPLATNEILSEGEMMTPENAGTVQEKRTKALLSNFPGISMPEEQIRKIMIELHTDMYTATRLALFDSLNDRFKKLRPTDSIEEYGFQEQPGFGESKKFDRNNTRDTMILKLRDFVARMEERAY